MPLPDVDRLLQMLLQLNQAVLLGVISTEAANVIDRNLRAVLDEYASGTAGRVPIPIPSR